jgi:hypothetical protein
MTASPYASDAKIAEACAAIGADLIGQTEQTLLQQLVVAAATNTGSAPTYSADITAFLGAANDTAAKEALGLAEVQPFVIAFKNVTVLTTGAPADVASVALPAWCTRYRLAQSGIHLVIAESAAGTLAGASFGVRDAAGGGGNGISNAFAGPASTSVVVAPVNSSTSVLPSTAGTIYLNQTANSANAGTISVYLMIVPLL